MTHENTKTNMDEDAPDSIAQDQKPPAVTIVQVNNGKGLPKRTLEDKMSIGGGSDRVDLYYFGRAHTNGDAWVVFPSARPMRAADTFSGKNIPLVDANNGSSGVEIPDTIQKPYDTVKNVDTIITGHSSLMTPADLKEYIAFNREFLNAMRAARKAGRTVDDVVATWKIPATYVGYATPEASRLKNNVQLLYHELDGAGS